MASSDNREHGRNISVRTVQSQKSPVSAKKTEVSSKRPRLQTSHIMKLSGNNSIKRVTKVYETDRHKRVMSPIEAERQSRMLYGNVSASFHTQALRSKGL